MKKILVTGGAGYIGSHMVLQLQAAGYAVVVLDNFSGGHQASVSGAVCVEGNCGDAAVLQALFKAHRFDAVMHFAGFIQVGESVEDPAKYYLNNVSGTLNLLQAMLRWKVNRFIFSSTAAAKSFSNCNWKPKRYYGKNFCQKRRRAKPGTHLSPNWL